MGNCFIESPEAALSHLRSLRGNTKARTHVLVGAARVFKEVADKCAAQRRLFERCRKHLQRVEDLRAADPQLFEHFVKEFPPDLLLACSGGVPASGKFTNPAERRLVGAIRAALPTLRKEWQKLGVPDLVFDYEAWRSMIIGEPPLVRDTRLPGAGDGLLGSAVQTPITRLLGQVVSALGQRVKEPAGLLPAFLCCLADAVALKRPTATQYVLLECAAAIAEPCSHAQWRDEYQRRRFKWEKRIAAPAVSEWIDALKSNRSPPAAELFWETWLQLRPDSDE